MSYIGSTPVTQSFISGTDYFNGDGTTTAFTLSRRVNSVNDIEVVVNNVEQQPNTVYTVNTNTLTFTTAPSSGTGNIYVRYLSTVSQSVVPSQGTVNSAQLGLITTIPTTGGNTITLPASTGTALTTASTGVVTQAMLSTNIAGNGPAFSAYQSSAQTIPNTTFTKMQFQTKEFDTNNNFDATTNYRFTPTVAGYYQINAALGLNITSGGLVIEIWKNGSTYKRGSSSAFVSAINAFATVSSVIYFNGSTDYVEAYAYQNQGSSASGTTGTAYNYFNGSLVRAA